MMLYTVEEGVGEREGDVGGLGGRWGGKQI